MSRDSCLKGPQRNKSIEQLSQLPELSKLDFDETRWVTELFLLMTEDIQGAVKPLENFLH